MTNLYQVIYKTSANARKVFTAIRCGKNAADSSLRVEGEIVVSVRYLGEHAGDWCQV